MTVEATTSRAQYSTNGTSGPWTVPFYFLENSHLRVIYTDADGEETLLALSVDYDVIGAGNQNGGIVTTTDAYVAGGSITVLRDVPATQLTDYRTADAFPANTHEGGLDKNVMLIQQVLEVMSRALVFGAAELTTPILPSVSARANRLLGFDAIGRPTALIPEAGGASALALDLLNTTLGSKGAALIAFDPSNSYDDDAKTVAAGLTRYIDAGYYLSHNSAIDQTAALIEAFEAGRDQGRDVVLPPWEIRVDGQLPLYSDLTVIGRGRSLLNFANTALSSTDALISGTGSLGTAALLTVAATKWTNQLTAPGSNIAVGDWFRVVSTVDANSASAGEDQLGERADVVPLGEPLQCVARPSADVIQVRGMLRFGYPIGAAVKKITPLSNVLLRDLTVEQASVSNRLVEATLADCMRINGLDVRNAGGEVIYRGCFNGSRIDHIKSHAAPDTALATNRQAVKITDGSAGVILADFDFANGGQMVDVTYTPSLSATLAAPTLDTLIQRGHIRNTSFSAITDHPTCDGTVIADVTMQQVRGAVYVRSRNATVKNVSAWGEFGATNGNGVWLGEDGYWNQATVEGCKMHGFDIGYLMAGSGADITRRDANLSHNLSSYCRVGERWGSVNTPDGSGCLSLGSRHLFPTEAGIEIGGDWVGLRVRDFLVRGGVPTVGAVNFTSSSTSVEIEGQVADIGGKPAITVSAGTPTDALIDIRRFGNVAQNSGLTPAMVRAKPRQIARVTSFLNTPLTGTTSETNLLTTWLRTAAGEFNACSQLVIKLRGTLTGTAGTKTFRCSTPGGDVLSQAFVLSASANGTFEITFTIDGTGDATQRAWTSFSADGLSAQDPGGPTNRTVAVAAGFSLNLSCQLASAADSVTMLGADAFLTTT
ncbi:hypothetical protein C1M51_02740 [Methylibium sp. Pch-M]|nr:hypothetical protein C1M51_02740 [Methylibium sp. Pch-M]